MMQIGIFANYLIFEKAGVGQYSRNLLRALLVVDKKNRYFLYFSFLRRRKERIMLIKNLVGSSANVQIKIFPLPAAWFEWLLITSLPLSFLIKDQLDVFFAPYPAGIPRVGFPNQSTKMVTTVHDLVFLRFPEHRGVKLSNYYRQRHKIAAENCQKIIAPSYSTKKDLEEFFGVPKKKIAVIPEAADRRFRFLTKKERSLQDRIVSRYFNPTIKYILSVGTLEPRKNLALLVQAYSLLPHALQSKYRLVLVGAKGWNNQALNRAIANLNLKERVILPGFVKDEDLPYIYSKAALFVYPSLYEGFGLPVLEAFVCGVPSIVANNSSLKEVAGRAALLVNNNEEVIAKAIKSILLGPKLREKLIKAGLLQVKKFSWVRAAKETLKVFG